MIKLSAFHIPNYRYLHQFVYLTTKTAQICC